MKKIKFFLGALLLSLMLIFEARYYEIKIFILLLLLLLNSRQIFVSNRVFKLYVPLCLSALIGILGGTIRGYENSFIGFTTGVLWPLVSFFIALPLLLRQENYKYLIQILFCIHSFLILYDLCYAFSIIYGFSFPNIYPEIEIPFSFYGNTSRMNFVNLNVLTYTIPVFLMLWLTKYEFGVTRLIQTIILLFSFFLLIISGRRSLMMIFPLAPLLAVFMGKQLSKDVVKNIKRYASIFISLLIIFILYFYITQPEVFEGYLFTFTKAFDSDEEPVKFLQAKQLMNTFIEYPLFGAGTGMKLYESIRGIWKYQFELTYLYMLASRGLIGFILYLIGVIGPFWIGLKYAKKYNDCLFAYLLVGYFLVLLADATNPVLCSFDLMVPLYLCYAKINSIIYNNRCL